MNNWIGLLIALSLAIVAGVLNWKYLERKSQEIEMVTFLAIGENTKIKTGDPFRENHFTAISIPRKQVGHLKNVAVLYSDRNTVVGMYAVHDYNGGEIIMVDELKTAPKELKLEKDEVAIFVSVNSNSFVSSLVKPGDMISFSVPVMENGVVPMAAPNQPERDSTFGDPDRSDEIFNNENFRDPSRRMPLFSGKTEILGQFKILALGGRLSSVPVARASGGRNVRENVITIAAKMTNGELDEKSKKLDLLSKQASARQISVILHSQDKKK